MLLSHFFAGRVARVTKPMPRVVLIRPGATELDDQGRMKGSLDMPLSHSGREQVERVASELDALQLNEIVSAPCQSAVETASRLARDRGLKVKVVECLRNVDHGLWHGKLIEEVRRTQPKVYRQGQECPWTLCPPGGETIQQAAARVEKAIRKLLRRAGRGSIALVLPDPMASIVQSLLEGDQLRDLWKSETDTAQWELIEAVG